MMQIKTITINDMNIILKFNDANSYHLHTNKHTYNSNYKRTPIFYFILFKYLRLSYDQYSPAVKTSHVCHTFY